MLAARVKHAVGVAPTWAIARTCAASTKISPSDNRAKMVIVALPLSGGPGALAALLAGLECIQ